MKYWTAPHTAFGRIPKWAAALLLALLSVLTAIPAIPHKVIAFPNESVSHFNDKDLYQAIVSDILTGQDYYSAAQKEHRAHGYPVTPPQVFREPTLALLLSALRFPFLGTALLVGMSGLLVLGLFREMVAAGIPSHIRVTAVIIASSGLSIAGIPRGVYLHEVWAGLLIAASLFLYRENRWWPSVIIAFVACLFRELALPFMLVMGVFAFSEGRRRQGSAWVAAILFFAALYSLHLYFASRAVSGSAEVSPGWVALGGWNFVIATARWNLALHYLPSPFVSFAILSSLLGLVGAQEPRARRAAATVGGYVTGLIFFGRPDNYYWGILYTPLLAGGLLYAPAALRDLVVRARGTRFVSIAPTG
jgi:hypothetical protein